jgi:hypothetical protein
MRIENTLRPIEQLFIVCQMQEHLPALAQETKRAETGGELIAVMPPSTSAHSVGENLRR